ncbi:MAG: histidinol-phosphatase [Alistipes sp.]|nr:histidinol-phosphatase [Alistipes sp.]
MKTLKLLLPLILMSILSASAQKQSILRHQPGVIGDKGVRNEIYIPKVMGYNVYKADLHTHTIYSDGDITPALRVNEAWCDGLDIIAITDHMEYRRVEREIFQYMKDYIDPAYRGKGAVNTNVLNRDPDSNGILVDFNVASTAAEKEAKRLGIMAIKGVEITRGKLGDYNALFTTDNNALYDPNLEQTIRNARAQGAFIIHNHPQYSKNTESTLPPHCEDFYAKGLIDGIELANGFNHYDRLFDYCFKGKYTPFATSDAHFLISARFPNAGKEYYRNMTLILAKDRTEKAVKEALRAGRTIAYSANMLIGTEKLLLELFDACVEVEKVGTDWKKLGVVIRNKSSLPFAVSKDGKNEYIVPAHGTAMVYVGRNDKVLNLTITNMLYGVNKSPKVSFKL